VHRKKVKDLARQKKDWTIIIFFRTHCAGGRKGIGWGGPPTGKGLTVLALAEKTQGKPQAAQRP